MIVHRLRRVPVLLLCALLSLSACESAEERAEGHYQSGLALLEEGDVARALVEFRNVFKLNGDHRAARQTYARIQRESGKISEAYGQYLRLVEQYPEDLEGRRALAEMAFAQNKWEEVERHTQAGIEHHPDDPALQILATTVDYRQAAINSDNSGKEEAITRLRSQLETSPESKIARTFLIGHLMSGFNPLDALPEVETALKRDENDFALQTIKLRLLNLQNDPAATEVQLKNMLRLFPDNKLVQGTLVSWYTDREQLDEAEAFLRQLAESSEDSGPNLTVVQFLRSTRSEEAAIAELDRLIASDGQTNVYRSVRAAMDFDMGRHDEALAAFENILKDATPSKETLDIKIAFARALAATGNKVGARAQVEEVLAEDASHVAALKLRAGWLIEGDKPGEAIQTLRLALDQAPRDAQILTLMARAHQRAGNRELAGERLSLAVEMSNRAPAESLRYARFLIEDDRFLAAESILIDALRLSNENLAILETLSGIYMKLQDQPREEGILNRLRRLEDPAAVTIANRLQTRLLLRQEKYNETIAFLEDRIARGEEGVGAQAVIVRTHINEGNIDAAALYLDEELIKAPNDPTLTYLKAGVHIINGELAQGEAIYRALIAEDPAREVVVRALYSLLTNNNRGEEADQVLEAALKANAGSIRLHLMKAQRLENVGDIEGAIAVYDALYAKYPNNPIIANNLASLMTSHRSDGESLQRAFAIARRLRNTKEPAFRDTYGWIEYRRGNFEEALVYLEPAAEGLPKDPLAQFHLGMTYLSLKKNDQARATLTRALDLAGDSDLPQFDIAREMLEKLDKPVEE